MRTLILAALFLLILTFAERQAAAQYDCAGYVSEGIRGSRALVATLEAKAGTNYAPQGLNLCGLNFTPEIHDETV
jgi:hypothetical protein